MTDIHSQDQTVVEEIKRNWIGTVLAGFLAFVFSAIGVVLWVLDWKEKDGNYFFTNLPLNLTELAAFKLGPNESLYAYALHGPVFWIGRFAFFIASVILVLACAWMPLTDTYGKVGGFILSIFNAFQVYFVYDVYDSANATSIIASRLSTTNKPLSPVVPMVIFIFLFLSSLLLCAGLMHQRKYRFLGLFAPFIIIPQKVQNEASA